MYHNKNPRPERRASDTLAYDGERLVVACISDTHSHPHPQSLERVAALAPDAILHLGDIGDLSVLPPFAEVAPLFAVRGNIDTTVAHGPPDHRRLIITREGQPISTWLLTHIALRGPRLLPRVREMAAAAEAQLVVCGHSHVPFLGMDRGLGVFNPGSIGPRRFSLPIVFGVITLTARGLDLKHISCETGAEWQPAAAP